MSAATESNEMRPEYDFSAGVRGKHHKEYEQGSNLILLEPDLAEIFKDSQAVNHALRMLVELAAGEIKKNQLNSN